MTETDLSTVLATLADPTRRKALALLHERDELCVCELMAMLGATQSRMSRHMAALKSVGLVVDRRDAQWIRYRRAPKLAKETAHIVEAVLAASKARSATATLRKASRAEPRPGFSS
jgi:ArsR family transcriptional regulator